MTSEGIFFDCIGTLFVTFNCDVSCQLMRYRRACSYHDVFDRGLLLTRQLLNQGFLEVVLNIECCMVATMT